MIKIYNKKINVFLLLIVWASTLSSQNTSVEFSNCIFQERFNPYFEGNGKIGEEKLNQVFVTNYEDGVYRSLPKEKYQETSTEPSDTLKKLSQGQKTITGISYDLAFGDTLDHSAKINFHISKAHFYRKYGKADSLYLTLQYLKELVNEKTADTEVLFEYYSLQSVYFGFKTAFIKELEYLNKAKNLLDTKQIEKLVLINQRIAIIYYQLLDFESSLRLFQNNLELIQPTNNNLSLLYTYYGIADSYLELEQYGLSKETCFKAIELHERTGLSKAFGFVYSLLGLIYVQENKIDSAEYYLTKGIVISKEQNDPKELFDNYSAMVKLQLLKKDTLKAQFYGEKAINNKIYHDIDLYDNLAMIYTHQKKYSQANELLQANMDYYREVNNKNFAFSLASSLLKDRFDREKVIQISRSKQEFQHSLLRTIIIAAVLLILLFSIIIYNQIAYRRKVQRINESLVEKNENLEQFAYICSHDLKEPIRNIGSFTGLIQQNLKKENLKFDYDEYFQIIKGGTSSLSQIVDSLKIFTNLNREGVISKSKISLDLALKDTIQSLSHLVQENKVSIFVNNEIAPQEILSSKYGIKLILSNIIQNAIKHNSSTKRTVDISIKKEKQDILITIEDNGSGIPKEYFEQIFLPFKTLKNKTTTESSGLGLAICTKIINIIGGKIWLDSEVGKGSKFYILLTQ